MSSDKMRFPGPGILQQHVSNLQYSASAQKQRSAAKAEIRISTALVCSVCPVSSLGFMLNPDIGLTTSFCPLSIRGVMHNSPRHQQHCRNLSGQLIFPNLTEHKVLLLQSQMNRDKGSKNQAKIAGTVLRHSSGLGTAPLLPRTVSPLSNLWSVHP